MTKRSSSPLFLSKATSFTLVELLVVMAIIAILAGVLFTAGSAAIAAAKRAKAANTANQIQTAVLNYYTEYSVYPAPTTEPAGTDFIIADTDPTDWASLLYGLCGNINPYTASMTPANANAAPNTRSIAFLNLKKSDVDVNNAPLNPVTSTTNPYFNIAINYSYSGVMGTAPSTISLPSFSGTYAAAGGTSTAGVAVWANCNTGSTTNVNFYVHTY